MLSDGHTVKVEETKKTWFVGNFVTDDLLKDLDKKIAIMLFLSIEDVT